MALSTVAIFLPDFVELLYCSPSRCSLPPHSISARFNVTLQWDHVASHRTVASTVEMAHQSPQKELTQSLWSSRLSFHQGSIVLSGDTGRTRSCHAKQRFFASCIAYVQQGDWFRRLHGGMFGELAAHGLEFTCVSPNQRPDFHCRHRPLPLPPLFERHTFVVLAVNHCIR